MSKGFKIAMAVAAWIATSIGASAAAVEGEYLIKMKDSRSETLSNLSRMVPAGTQIESLGFKNWAVVRMPENIAKFRTAMFLLGQMDGVEYVQPNYKVKLLENPNLGEQVAQALMEDCPIPIPGFCDIFPIPGAGSKDNPDIPMKSTPGTGDDPELGNQWGMANIGAAEGWKHTKGDPSVVVAVIDTGVDYTHEDLVDNLWRNPGESGDKANNGKDDDGNGYVDDVIGWDFVTDDNKPFDLKGNILQGGNPGHGTHCAGNVAARGFNGKGISGVAPNVSIMVVRFLGEAGQGSTEGAIKSIRYAVDNGAKVLSNSWGSSGEDPNDEAGNRALREAVQYSQDKGALFIAAAGNGGQDGQGDNNDTAQDASYPATYPHDIIISVAATDSADGKGGFSNYGAKSVDIGAPGVKVYSTIVGNGYSDTVMPLLGATWDGTSMATPHVAGAAALYWSKYKNKSWQQVKAAIMNSAVKIDSMSGKSVSGGKLNVEKLMLQK
jgi:thermitase